MDNSRRASEERWGSWDGVEEDEAVGEEEDEAVGDKLILHNYTNKCSSLIGNFG